MPEIRLTDTFRELNGIAVPSADPSKRLRGEWIEVTEEELEALTDEFGEGGLFPDLSEENLEVRQEGSENETDGESGEGDEGPTLEDVVGESTAEALREAGFGTLQEAQSASEEELGDVTGIGPATISDIREA